MIIAVDHRLRSALGAGLLATACFVAQPGVAGLGDTLAALLLIEAAACGAAAGALTAGFYGGAGGLGVLRALLGGCVGAAAGLGLFAAGGGVWLTAPGADAAFTLSALSAMYPPAAATLGLALHALALSRRGGDEAGSDPRPDAGA